MNNNIKNFYESDSVAYDLRWEKKGGQKTSEAQKQIVNYFIKSWKGYNILEIGCGSGRFSSLLASSSRNVTYMDLTKGMLDVTKNKLKQEEHSFVGVNGSVINIPFANETKDAIISINVMNHIEDFKNSLVEFKRVLKPNGKLLINVTNLYSIYFPFALFVNLRKSSIGRKVYSVWSKPNQVQKELFDIGFDIREVVGHVFVPLFLDKAIIRNIPIFFDKFSNKKFFRKISPVLFYYCEKR